MPPTLAEISPFLFLVCGRITVKTEGNSELTTSNAAGGILHRLLGTVGVVVHLRLVRRSMLADGVAHAIVPGDTAGDVRVGGVGDAAGEIDVDDSDGAIMHGKTGR